MVNNSGEQWSTGRACGENRLIVQVVIALRSALLDLHALKAGAVARALIVEEGAGKSATPTPWNASQFLGRYQQWPMRKSYGGSLQNMLKSYGGSMHNRLKSYDGSPHNRLKSNVGMMRTKSKGPRLLRAHARRGIPLNSWWD